MAGEQPLLSPEVGEAPEAFGLRLARAHRQGLQANIKWPDDAAFNATALAVLSNYVLDPAKPLPSSAGVHGLGGIEDFFEDAWKTIWGGIRTGIAYGYFTGATAVIALPVDIALNIWTSFDASLQEKLVKWAGGVERAQALANIGSWVRGAVYSLVMIAAVLGAGPAAKVLAAGIGIAAASKELADVRKAKEQLVLDKAHYEIAKTWYKDQHVHLAQLFRVECALMRQIKMLEEARRVEQAVIDYQRSTKEALVRVNKRAVQRAVGRNMKWLAGAAAIGAGLAAWRAS